MTVRTISFPACGGVSIGEDESSSPEWRNPKRARPKRRAEAAIAASLERRQERRHEVRRRCLVCPCDEGLPGIEGVTKDVSRRGILVQFPGGVFPEILRQVGNSARIWIDLPANSNFSPRYLEHLARVVRVSEAEKSVPLVAFEVYRVRVRSSDGKAPQDAEAARPATLRIQ